MRPDAWKVPWSTGVVPYRVLTGDERLFLDDSLEHRTLPMPLMLQIQTADGHKGAVVVGAVTGWDPRMDGPVASGTWLDPEGVPEVRRAIAIMDGRVATVSADLEPNMQIDVIDDPQPGEPRIIYRKARACGITIVPIAAFDHPSLAPVPIFGETDLALTGTTSWRTMPAQPREIEYNADQAFKNILAWSAGNDARARTMFLWIDPQAAEGTRDRFRLPIGDVVNGRPVLNFHAIYAASALISGAHGGLPTVSDREKARLRETISAIYKRLSGLYGDPALEAPWDKRAKMPDTKASLNSIAASAAPIAPPAEWFSDPKLPGPTPTAIVTPEGRVMVHLACKDSCYRPLFEATGQCLEPPPSPSGYARFMDGSVLTAGGKLVRVGRVTADTMHADGLLASGPARAHYDNTGTCVAIVAAGEDEHGIWLSGSLVPEATAEQVAMLRRSPLSGDWRRHGHEGLDLIAALAVNTAGFPAPVTTRGGYRQLAVDGGECVSLVASGTPGDNNAEGGSMGNKDATAGTVDATAAVTEPAAVEPAAAPVVDMDAVVSAAVAQITERQRIQDGLAVLIELDAQDRQRQLDELQPIGALACGGKRKPQNVLSDGATGTGITTGQRRGAEKAGKTMEGGRYPIRNVDDLKSAIRAVGRGAGSHDEIRRWIMSRARALKVPNLIPDNWNPDGSIKDGK